MRIAVDTNVLVSAVATRGLCADVLQLILLEHELVVGETVLAELRVVLGRKLGLRTPLIEETETFLRRRAVVAAGGRRDSTPGLDAADSAVVGEAAGAEADVLVTGDADLLRLGVASVKVVSPRGLWDLLRGAA